jgi:hypothetical protein
LPSPGSLVRTPTGAGIRATGTISRTAPATGGRAIAAMTPAATAVNTVRRSTRVMMGIVLAAAVLRPIPFFPFAFHSLSRCLSFAEKRLWGFGVPLSG